MVVWGEQNCRQLLELIFCEKPSCAGFARCLAGILIIVLCQDYDAGLRAGCDDLPGGQNAVEARHLDVHQYPIRREVMIPLHGLLSAAALKYFSAELAQQRL